MLKYTIHLQRGLTLIELMIGMLLGVFILGGVISVFIANSETARTKRELDKAQEAFRFASYTISRIVRNSDEILNTSGNLVLAVSFQRDTLMPDCLNDTTNATVTNVFTFQSDPNDLNNGQLLCNNGGANSEVIADGFDINKVGFMYGVFNGTWIAEATTAGATAYVPAANIDGTAPMTWGNVISVRVDMRTQTEMGTVFTATARPRLLSLIAGP